MMRALFTLIVLLLAIPARGDHALQGVLLDFDTREPIAGARLQLEEPARRDGGHAASGAPFYSDAEGRFTLPDALPSPGSVALRVRVEASGYASKVDLVTGHRRNNAAHSRVILLRAAGTLRGRVTDVDGNPISGAAVVPFQYQAPDFGWHHGGASRATSGAEGRREIADAPLGGEEVTTTLTRAEGRVRVTVLDRDEFPIPNATVSLSSGDEWRSGGEAHTHHTALTNAVGVAEAATIEAECILVRATYVRDGRSYEFIGSVDRARSGLTEYTLHDPGTKMMEVTGCVQDVHTGKGIAGVTGELHVFLNRPIPIVTDAAGEYHFRGEVEIAELRRSWSSRDGSITDSVGGWINRPEHWYPRTSYSTGDDYPPDRLSLLNIDLLGDGITLRVPLESGEPRAGTVLLSDGVTPASGAKLQSFTQRGYLHEETIVDANGRFAISMNQGFGGSILVVHHEAGGTITHTDAVHWPAGAERDIELHSWVMLAGRVTDPNQEPIPRIPVRLIPRPPLVGREGSDYLRFLSRVTETDENGDWRCETTLPTHHQVEVLVGSASAEGARHVAGDSSHLAKCSGHPPFRQDGKPMRRRPLRTSCRTLETSFPGRW